MAERIVSPGVFTRENDLSFLSTGIGQIGAAFIGPFKKGPAFVPTIVNTQSDFENIFGTPDGTYYTEYAVQNYLREAGTATIVRVGGVGGYKQAGPVGLFLEGNETKLVGVLYSNTKGKNYQYVTSTATILSDSVNQGSFVIKGTEFNGATGISASLDNTSANKITAVFGSDVNGSKYNAYAYKFFANSASLLLQEGGVDVASHILPLQDFGMDAQPAMTPMVQSQLINGERYDLFQFETLGDGTTYNTEYKVSISNVKAAGEDGATDYSVFTVTIRKGNDTDKRKSVLETYNNVNLDPASPNYIARRIGDRNIMIDNTGKITETGDYVNQSKYVRVIVSEPGSFPISAAPFGHEAYYNPIKAGSYASLVPTVVFSTGSLGNGTSNPIYYSGFDFETAGVYMDNENYLAPLPNGEEIGANISFGFDSADLGLTYQMTGSATADMVKRQFTLAFQGGFDGTNPITPIYLGSNITDSNTQGFDLSKSTASGSIAYNKAIAAISNADEYDINMVVTPGVIRTYHPAVTTAVIDMVEARQDAFYIADFVGVSDSIAEVTFQANEVDSNYVGTYYPWVKTVDANTNKLTAVPPSTLLPAVYAANDRLAAEWFAPAGLNRGGITGAVSVLNRLTHAERDTLYENKVNPIAAFPGQGIVAFGQKTLQDKASALDRINVRRLLINLKKFIASTSRYLVFEQNTSTTRLRFLNTVNPYLEAVQQRQGLYSFKVVMDETNNTPDVIDRNILAGAIYLQPAKTAEFIVIDFNILPTGASFNA